jgi:hypothetical protein
MVLDVNLLQYQDYEDQQYREYRRDAYEAFLRRGRKPMSEVIFDEADDDSFWTRDIGMVRRRTARRSEAKPIPAPVPTEEIASGEFKALKKELDILKKNFEKQSEFVQKLLPRIDRINQVFADALLSMEADSVDDVYHIGEMRKEFASIRTELSKYLPKVETVVDPRSHYETFTANW